MRRQEDLTGTRFGHVVVLEMLYNYQDTHRTFCRCKCDCGNECIKDCYALRHKQRYTAHCGCRTYENRANVAIHNRQDLVGRRFGSAVVREMIYEKFKPTRVVCECDCGNIFETAASYLKTGDTTSCGCRQKAAASEANTKDFTGIVSDYGVKFISRHSKNDKGQFLWTCQCGCCGTLFVALPAKVLNGHITSCGCARRSSRERLIKGYLDELQVVYDTEYTFDDCRNVHKLRFDFYIPSLNTAIEYQGEQHYRPVSIYGGEEELAIRQTNDKIKREYCAEHGVILIEIPYSKTDQEIKETITNIVNP